MRKSRFTEEQMVGILREADRSPVAEVAKKHGVSEKTVYLWRKRYGQLETADVRQLRTLQQAVGRAGSGDRGDEGDHLKKVVSAPARRALVPCMVERGISQRRACALLGIARSALRYEARLPVKDAAVTDRMKHHAARHPRFGYRRIHVYLKREGYTLGVDRMHRLWRQAKLQVPVRRPRRRIAGSRPRPLPATGPNQVWAYDFVHDTCANGQSLKCLVVTDEWTHEALAIDVQGTLRSTRVIEVLSRLVSEHGAPCHLRSDNGPEFVSRAVQAWLRQSGIETALIEPVSLGRMARPRA